MASRLDSPIHYLDQFLHIIKYTPRNTCEWNFIWNSNIFIQEKAFEHDVFEMAAIFVRGGDVLRARESSWSSVTILLTH